MLKVLGKKIFTFYTQEFCLSQLKRLFLFNDQNGLKELECINFCLVFLYLGLRSLSTICKSFHDI